MLLIIKNTLFTQQVEKNKYVRPQKAYHPSSFYEALPYYKNSQSGTTPFAGVPNP